MQGGLLLNLFCRYDKFKAPLYTEGFQNFDLMYKIVHKKLSKPTGVSRKKSRELVK